MAKPATNEISTSEFQVWYDAVDGARRVMNALDMDGVQQIIADLHEDENRRQALAGSVGLSVEPHEYNFGIHQVTTTSAPVAL